MHTTDLITLAHSNVIIPQHSFLQTLVCHSPAPCPSCLAAEETLRGRRRLEQAVFLHGLDLMAGSIGEEVVEVLIFQSKSIPGDACIMCQRSSSVAWPASLP